MKFKNLVLLSAITFFIVSCSTSFQVRSDIERGVDFSAYSTYQIVKQDTGFPLGASPINKQRIDRAIQREMNTLNFIASDNPDILVSWFVKVSTVRDVDTYRNYYGRYQSRGITQVYDYREGTLIIDIIDTKKEQVIWHGATKSRVYEGMKDIEKKIDIAVKTMIKRFNDDANLNRLEA